MSPSDDISTLAAEEKVPPASIINTAQDIKHIAGATLDVKFVFLGS